MNETAIETTPTTTTPAVPVAPSSSGSTPPATSVATANQAAADAAALAAAKTPTPASIIPGDVTPPAEVAYTLALPKDAQIEAGAVERLTAFAKAHQLAPDVAQKALDLADAEVKADRAALAKTWQTLTQETWVAESKADAEIGGDKFIGAVTNSKRVMDAYADADFKQFLEDTKFGNNKHVIRFMNRIGGAMANDKLVNGNSGGNGAPKTDAQALYPGMNP